MSETDETRDAGGEVELDLVAHRGDTEPTEEARQAQSEDVPVDVEERRDRDRERGSPLAQCVRLVRRLGAGRVALHEVLRLVRRRRYLVPLHLGLRRELALHAAARRTL